MTKNLILSLVLGLSLVIVVSLSANATAQTLSIPSWIKNNAKYWSQGQIGDSDFTKGIEYLINQGIMKIPQTKPSPNQSHGMPSSLQLPQILGNTRQVVQTLTLQVASIFPQDGVTLTNFPASLQIQVTRGGIPVQGSRVQFWMEGGLTDDAMHNAGLTVTDSSGYAHLTLLNQNTLDAGQYIWYATAYKTGFKSGSSRTIFFTIPFSNSNSSSTRIQYGTNFLSSALAGSVFTDQKEYSIGQEKNTDVRISGDANNYHLGQPIILKIKSPNGKVTQLVAYGTYLGAFQIIYKLGQNSEVGLYTVGAYHNYTVFSTSAFNVVKSG